MKYSEYTATYKKTLKKYPALSSVFSEKEEPVICLTNSHYTKKGSKWILTDCKAKMVDCIHYTNIIDAVPWFRNLGGYERVNCTYTKYGYIPYEVISISPDRTEKSVYKFDFK